MKVECRFNIDMGIPTILTLNHVYRTNVDCAAYLPGIRVLMGRERLETQYVRLCVETGIDLLCCTQWALCWAETGTYHVVE